MPLPPTTPFTLQVTAVFEVPCTVAVNCRVVFVRTDALDGEMPTAIVDAATMERNAVFEVSPSGVVTNTGTDSFGAGALPVALSAVAEPNVVGSTTPSNLTAVGSALYFTTGDPLFPKRLWKLS